MAFAHDRRSACLSRGEVLTLDGLSARAKSGLSMTATFKNGWRKGYARSRGRRGVCEVADQAGHPISPNVG